MDKVQQFLGKSNNTHTDKTHVFMSLALITSCFISFFFNGIESPYVTFTGLGTHYVEPGQPWLTETLLFLSPECLKAQTTIHRLFILMWFHRYGRKGRKYSQSFEWLINPGTVMMLHCTCILPCALYNRALHSKMPKVGELIVKSINSSLTHDYYQGNTWNFHLIFAWEWALNSPLVIKRISH